MNFSKARCVCCSEKLPLNVPVKKTCHGASPFMKSEISSLSPLGSGGRFLVCSGKSISVCSVKAIVLLLCVWWLGTPVGPVSSHRCGGDPQDPSVKGRRYAPRMT